MPSRINPTLVLFKQKTLIKFHNIGLNEIILRVGLILLSFCLQSVLIIHFKIKIIVGWD